jgi:DNA-binding GntR family transcriptional regulator
MGSLGGLQIRNLRNAPERLTAHEIVREILRHAILNGDLPGGTRLVQTEVAAQLAVSTTPVREALRDLASDQLIRFHPHRGAVVQELDIEEGREIYEIRGALEPLAIRRAASRITKKELREATEVQARMERETNAAVWVEDNWKFHAILQGAARSPRLTAFIKSVQDSAALYVAQEVHIDPDTITNGNADHRAILASLRRGDADAAVEILHRHLDTALQAMVNAAAGADRRAALPRPGGRAVTG